MKKRKVITCPLEITHDIIRGKWKSIILWQLGRWSSSLSELKKRIKGISQKMLLEQLKELQEYELVGKKEFSGYPLKVEYFITGRGMRLFEIIKTMQDLGVEIMIEKGMEDELRGAGWLGAADEAAKNRKKQKKD